MSEDVAFPLSWTGWVTLSSFLGLGLCTVALALPGTQLAQERAGHPGHGTLWSPDGHGGEYVLKAVWVGGPPGEQRPPRALEHPK